MYLWSHWLQLVVALVLGATWISPVSVVAQAPATTLGLVINENGNSIAVLDPATDTIVGVQDWTGVLNKPHLATFDPSSRRLYVGNKGANLVVFDLADVLHPKVVANVKPGGNGEIHWLVLADGLVWLAHMGDSAVYAYDPADLTTPKVTLGKTEGFSTTHGLALRPGTQELWSTNRPSSGPGFVLRVDAHTRSVLGGPLPTTGVRGDQPNNVGFTPDGRWGYAVNTGSKATQITLIDATKFEVVAQIEQDPALGLAPHAITYEPVSRRMFVVNKDSGYASAIDVSTNTIAGYIPIGKEPHGVSVGDDPRIRRR